MSNWSTQLQCVVDVQVLVLSNMTQLTCLLTLQGARSLRSAATRAGLLQLRRPVSTQPPRPQAVKANADTTKLSNEEASALGASKKPPGSNPGSFMHQQGNLNTKNNKWASNPKLGIVSSGESRTLSFQVTGLFELTCKSYKRSKWKLISSLNDLTEVSPPNCVVEIEPTNIVISSFRMRTVVM